MTFCEERKEKFYIINDLFVRNNMVEKMRKDEGNVDNTLNAKDKEKKRKLASSATG